MDFDLVVRPWVPVVDIDGERREVGLAHLLLGAHRFRRIVGDTPPMTAALYRLVLALVYRVYPTADRRSWARLWQGSRFEFPPLLEYFGRHRDRFDLFHPERPFLQCPGLAATTRSTIAKLVPYRASGNNATLFDHTTAADHPVLSPAEAARWLVTALAFDPGGMKTPYLKEKSSERAPCNYFGVVLVEGATLRETLLLNLVRYDPAAEHPRLTWPDDQPTWENPEPPSPLPQLREPAGWTDLLTWPSRRILLSAGEINGQPVVDRVVMTPGTRLRAQLLEVELMAAFRRPMLNGKPKKDAPLLPVRLHQVRGVWRYSAELLLGNEVRDNRHRQGVGTLDRVAELVHGGHIREDAVYTLRVFGQKLDKNNSVVESWGEEEVPAPAALLRADSRRIGKMIGHAVKLADDVGDALYAMERDHRAELAAGPGSALELGYWPRLVEPFGEFLREVAEAHRTGRSAETATGDWARVVRTTAVRAADRWAEGSPRTGRNLLAAGKAHARLTGRLHGLIELYHKNIAAYVPREDTA